MDKLFATFIATFPIVIVSSVSLSSSLSGFSWSVLDWLSPVPRSMPMESTKDARREGKRAGVTVRKTRPT